MVVLGIVSAVRAVQVLAKAPQQEAIPAHARTAKHRDDAIQRKSVNGVTRLEREGSDRNIKLLAAFADHLIRAVHLAQRRFELTP